MFSLRIHWVDTNHHLTRSFGDEGGATFESASTNRNPKFQERRGVVHLYRNVSSHSSSLSPNPNTLDSTLLFVLAVPSQISSDDFIRFCGSFIDHVLEILIIRNDAIKDRYSVLIKLVNQKKANCFYHNFNGKRFSSTEAKVCRILFAESVEYSEFAEIAGTPPPGFTELPTCPVCLERLDQDTSGILTTLCNHSFQCPSISKWTDSSCLVCRFCQQQAEKPSCSVCGPLENLWICVICGFIGCGRYKEGHAMRHWKDTQHSYSLDLHTQKVWDYVGDTYVHRLNQSKTDGKLAELNSGCRSFNGNFGTCECSKESGISGELLSYKVEAIVDEYNHLLASQLENQRQYYETLMEEAKAVEKAVNSKMQEIELNIEKCVEEKKVVASINDNLMKNQELWRRKVMEIKERLTDSSLTDTLQGEQKDNDKDLWSQPSQRRPVQSVPQQQQKKTKAFDRIDSNIERIIDSIEVSRIDSNIERLIDSIEVRNAQRSVASSSITAQGSSVRECIVLLEKMETLVVPFGEFYVWTIRKFMKDPEFREVFCTFGTDKKRLKWLEIEFDNA